MKIKASDNPVDAAVAEGKILPSRRAFYQELMAKDPEGTRRTLAKLVPVFVDGYEPESDEFRPSPPPRPAAASGPTAYPENWVGARSPGPITFEDADMQRQTRMREAGVRAADMRDR